ncbi:MAG: dihydropteroate synthase [Deltaproteobacteria bacterium]|nr:dihydropteroate synthase [Deltaproteobacteria bacterium]
MDFTLSWSDYVLNLDQKTHVMGILNATPDSFSDGGRYLEVDKAVEHAVEMAREGADIIDVGAESTRPYSKKVSSHEELDRVIPIIEILSKELIIPISIDTCKAVVAQESLKAGASIINDISSLRFDPDMASIAAQAEVPLVLMHMKGTPQGMQKNPVYNNVISEILDFLKDSIKRSKEAGVKEDLIIVDPGIGFGKTVNNNLEIIRELSRFGSLKRPVLLGTSNKAFIGYMLDKAAHERDTGTMATIAAGVMNGAHIVRVHNVKKAVETVKMIDAIKRGQAGNS